MAWTFGSTTSSHCAARLVLSFRTFVRYDMRFEENIGVGRIDEVEGYLELSEKPATVESHSSIVEAAEESQAASLARQFRHGYRQMLGRRFAGGVELSGSEWQKIALARAYIRKAQIVILDEPTAALDARAEYEVFSRFIDLVAGQTAVLISHRFSTVRMADRIIVLQRGEILEQGSHEELLSRRGLYAELFSLQAEGYR